MIYYCFYSFCSGSAEKIVIIEVVVVTLELLAIGRVRISITSDSKKIKKL